MTLIAGASGGKVGWRTATDASSSWIRRRNYGITAHYMLSFFSGGRYFTPSKPPGLALLLASISFPSPHAIAADKIKMNFDRGACFILFMPELIEAASIARCLQVHNRTDCDISLKWDIWSIYSSGYPPTTEYFGLCRFSRWYDLTTVVPARHFSWVDGRSDSLARLY